MATYRAARAASVNGRQDDYTECCLTLYKWYGKRAYAAESACAWLQEFQAAQEKREELKQQIALAATKLLQDPENHSRELQPLVQLVSSKDEVVS